MLVERDLMYVSGLFGFTISQVSEAKGFSAAATKLHWIFETQMFGFPLQHRNLFLVFLSVYKEMKC